MTPDVRVLRGEPDDVELAALVAGLAGAAAAGHTVAEEDDAARERAGRLRWRTAANGLRQATSPGPDAWRWSTQA